MLQPTHAVQPHLQTYAAADYTVTAQFLCGFLSPPILLSMVTINGWAGSLWLLGKVAYCICACCVLGYLWTRCRW